MSVTLFDPKDIPKELLDCFEEVLVDCNSPWVRVTETERHATRPNNKSKYGGLETDVRSSGPGNVAFGLAVRTEARVKTLGWQPSCSCNAPIRPAVIFDPFMGSGTTVLCADRLGRHGIGLELSKTYCDMAQSRLANETPLFTAVAPAVTVPEQGGLFEVEA